MAASTSTAGIDVTVQNIPAAAEGFTAEAALHMDRMYRYQRHIYDLTRKFYLVGRDQLLAALPVRAGDRVLEMGCGTGRNLVKLQRLRPHAQLYGMDVSQEMLTTAASALNRAGCDEVRLAQAAGQNFDPQASFGVECFDIVYFSYVLSMIPNWQDAVSRAYELVRPGGVLAVVDFADQSLAPAWRRWLLLRWLALFDVHPRSEIERTMDDPKAQWGQLLWAKHLMGGYAYLSLRRKPVL
jgi:S-adenosylmethionine-diacylgycerolhomoserine-N-methlytransferase